MIVSAMLGIFILYAIGCCRGKDLDVPTGECDKGWIPYDGHCYLFSKEKMSWYDAKIFCNEKEAYLARVETRKENIWLQMQARILTKERTYLGGTDAGHEGTWRWESNADEIEFSDWGRGEPSGSSKENCLLLIGNGVLDTYQWHDIPCVTQYKFVCEKEWTNKHNYYFTEKKTRRGSPVTVIHNYEGN